MEIHTRRAIAYIAGRLLSGSTSAHIYDYGESTYTSFAGNVSDEMCQFTITASVVTLWVRVRISTTTATATI